MENDFDTMKQAFDKLKVEYEVVTAKEEHGDEIHTSDYDGKATWDKMIKLENGVGYFCFNCQFYFLDNKYQGHGVWE